MEIIQANKENFDEVTGKGYVLVDFHAAWCGPCKMLSPILKKIKDQIQIVEVNIDTDEDIAVKYGVMSIPSLFLIKDGKIVSEKVGFVPEELLIQWIDENK